MTAKSPPNKMRLLMLAFALFMGAVAGGAIAGPSWAEDARHPPTESITHLKLAIRGNESAFTATAGTLPLTDSKGEPQAWMSFVAYTRDDAARESRPISFVFNGGPGASSAYLHVGALGPRVVDFGTDGRVPSPPARMIDNPDSWLDLSDLVFIDPVGTGYSRTVVATGEANQRYWGVREDLQSFSAFIDLYLSRNGRVASPKYLVGESYGGFRAARLAQVLSNDHGIGVAGLFLISPVLEFSLLSGGTFEPLPYAFRLPSYAASAAALGTTGMPEVAAMADVERFALGAYLSALIATPRDEAALRATHAEVARRTGLPQAIVDQYDARVPPGIFTKEMRRANKQILSRYDGSISGPDPYPDSNGARGDPIMDGLRPLLTGAMVDYLSTVLGQRTELIYQLTNGEILRRWNWRSTLGSRDGAVGSADELREALAANANLKVVIAHGITDLVTPYLTSRYVIDRLPPSLTRDRVSLSVLPGGHMMYLRPVSRARLHADAAKLYPPPK